MEFRTDKEFLKDLAIYGEGLMYRTEAVESLLAESEEGDDEIGKIFRERARKARGTSEDEEEFRKMLHRRMEWNARAATAVLYYFRFLTVRAMRDEELARHLVDVYGEIIEEVEPREFYMEKLLMLKVRHEIEMDPAEDFSEEHLEGEISPVLEGLRHTRAGEFREASRRALEDFVKTPESASGDGIRNVMYG